MMQGTAGMTMKVLLILRHAEAVPAHPGCEDFVRALTEAGTVHAAKLAHWLCDRIELPDQILCSPSPRARQTLAPLLAMRPVLDARTNFLPQLYGASVRTLTTLLDRSFAESDRVLIVGHNPGLEELASEVLEHGERSRFGHLTASTLLVIGFAKGWPDGGGYGRLTQTISGEQLTG